ncbi:hypothetical protein MKW98_003746 [Papaver atlanticum]|uniref:Uncharacterized protein n=1 Tax=Papaver atlanticum TaxID=357466 RepID=A0AAD4XQ21_9MAGN|nr:hypothetical protein MKW98_003746 [Papaver atlanticum]
MQNRRQNGIVLEHCKDDKNQTDKDVTALGWNGERTLLATASLDAKASILFLFPIAFSNRQPWDLRGTLTEHKGPIISLKWNKDQFEFHSGSDCDTFATRCADGKINICKVGESRPVKTFLGHKGEVNSVKWDASGSLLASCSEDCTAKIWSMNQDDCVYDLKMHTKEVYAVKWSPSCPGTSNRILASASFDTTIKLWDVEHRSLVRILDGQRYELCVLYFIQPKWRVSGKRIFR